MGVGDINAILNSSSVSHSLSIQRNSILFRFSCTFCVLGTHWNSYYL